MFLTIFIVFLVAITVLTFFAVRFVIRRDRQLRADYQAQRSEQEKNS